MNTDLNNLKYLVLSKEKSIKGEEENSESEIIMTIDRTLWL